MKNVGKQMTAHLRRLSDRVLESATIGYVGGDGSEWEREALVGLARDGELAGWRHEGFWQCMDTLKEAQELNGLWASGRAPWRVWA
jgi:glucose-1-phosphate cytidylyltransferase